MDEELWLESRIYPWLDDPSCETGDVFGEYQPDIDCYCEECGCGMTADEENGPCPDCGHFPEE
jgi:hypothetical protein